MLEGKFLDKHNFSLDDNTLRTYSNNLEEDATVSISSNTCCDKSYGGWHPSSDCKLHSSRQCISNCSSHGFTDFTESHSIYTDGPPLNIPLNLTLSKRILDSFKLHRRTRSTNYYGNPLQYVPTFSQAKRIISPSEKWIYNSMFSDEKERKPSKDSAIFNLAGLKGQEIELSTLTKSPSSFGHISLDKTCEGYTIGRRRSASKLSDLTFITSSSSKSTCSYQSELSEYDVVSKGLLRHTWKDGLPYFEFSLTDEHGEVYIANAWKVNSLHDKALDYIYTFFARTNKRKGGSVNNIYHVIGQMKVSSSLSFSSDKSKLVETEFVLFYASDNTKDLLCSSSGLSRSKGLPERMLNVFRQTEINSQTSSPYDANFEYGKLSKETGDSSLLVETFPSGYLKNCFTPNLEMAAIVVREHQHTERAEKAAGGWGLKFLERPDDMSHEPPCLPKPVRAGDESSRSMVVLIPARSHGGPSTTVGGPSSLTERWRTGGHCDCGGWDIGCPLAVLKDQSTCSTASPVESSQEDLASVNFIVEGTKQGEPAALSVMALNEGLHAISFQSKLSALQAFSVGVAMIHSQAPALRAEF